VTIGNRQSLIAAAHCPQPQRCRATASKRVLILGPLNLSEDSRSRNSDALRKFVILRALCGGSRWCLWDSHKKRCGLLGLLFSRFDLSFRQDIVWESCDTFGVDRPLPGLYCAHVEVPMDYHDDSAGTANLAVIKYTAAEPGKSKGSVFINPGVYRHLLPRTSPLIYLGKVVLVGLEHP